MKVLELSRYALCVSIAVAMLAGCGGSQLPIGALQQSAKRWQVRDMSSGSGYRVLFNFGRYQDFERGARPEAGLIGVSGILYGTTAIDGSSYFGTVFRITRDGRQRVLHSFSDTDGADPTGNLVYAAGRLYGTTSGGGSTGHGIVFAVNLDGTNFRVLHTFKGGSDGAEPLSGLIAVNGWLYGTTYNGGGGTTGSGTVFGMRLSDNEERILHRFGDPLDGGAPVASLTYAGGTLYGTTQLGGANQNNGTVFSVRLADDKEHVLHSFDGSDGTAPEGALLIRNGVLYGTTYEGGTDSSGTVFSIGIRGSRERVLHSFSGGLDGGFPKAGLVSDATGILYGTTYYGGASGYGTVFSIDSSGKEMVLHNFGDGYQHDGLFPQAPLLHVKRKLYGTTFAGGRRRRCIGSYCDYGTVFVLTL
jgi:uncharacterized repeat protein (TIGR03803 family)